MGVPVPDMGRKPAPGGTIRVPVRRAIQEHHRVVLGRIRVQIAGTMITSPPGRVLTVCMRLVPVLITSNRPAGNSPARSGSEICPKGCAA